MSYCREKQVVNHKPLKSYALTKIKHKIEGAEQQELFIKLNVKEAIVGTLAHISLY